MIRTLRNHLWYQRESWRTRRLEGRARRLARHPDPQGHALVFTAAGVGSLGDEAMLVVAANELRRRGVDRVTLVSYGPGDPWPAIPPFADVLDFGMRYAVDFRSTAEQWLAACTTATHAVVLGADVMDGHYSPAECIRRCVYARISAAAGLWATIAGFSFNDRPHPWCVASLRDLPPTVNVVARDPVSQGRVERAIGRAVIGGADLAFLLTASASPDLADWRDWCQAERSAGRLVLGVNANLLVAAGLEPARAGEVLAAHYAAGLAALDDARGPLSLALLPHDYRKMKGRLTDLEILQGIASALPPALAAHTRLLEAPVSAEAMKSLAGSLDLVLSGRMHLAIAALGSGVPAAGVVYQGKFEGLYQHLGLDGLCLTPDELVAGDRLGPFLVNVVDRRAALAASIGERLPAVKELARRNFEGLAAD